MHSIGHGGGEEHHLRLSSDPSANILDLGPKAHIQHPIGFVQNEGLEAGEVHPAFSHMVDEAPRGRHDDLHAAAQSFLLGTVCHSPHDGRHPNRGALGKGLRILRHLLSQLPGWAENQDLKPSSDLDLLQTRDHESPRFTRPGLGDTHDILPLKGGGNGFPLYGGGLNPPQRLHCRQLLFRQRQFPEQFHLRQREPPIQKWPLFGRRPYSHLIYRFFGNAAQ